METNVFSSCKTKHFSAEENHMQVLMKLCFEKDTAAVHSRTPLLP